jgi:hypothetical protein
VLALAGALLVLSTTAFAAGVEVEARIDPTLVGTGQFVTLTLEARVEGGIDLEIEPHFSLTNLEIAAGPSQSQQVSFVNGRVSRSQTLSWTLRALAVGTARVQNLRLAVNDEIFEMPEQVVEVQEEPIEQIDPMGRIPRSVDPFEDFLDPMRRRRRSAAPQEPKLFLRAEATPQKPYVGQQVLYSLLLFTQADIGAVSPDKMPDFEGMWAIEIEQPQRPKSVMTEIQGERYGRVVLLQKALFPLRPGELHLEAVEARLIAKIPDYSWMGLVGSYDKEFSLSSNPITLDVQAIPDPPHDFNGAVGDFELSADLEPQEIQIGDAATLTLTLSGRGHVEGLAEPMLPPLEGVRVFPPQRGGGDRALGTTIHGTKTWSYVLVPERPGVWEIPIPGYAYFDRGRARHEVTEAQARVLIARAGKQSETALPVADAPATPDETEGVNPTVVGKEATEEESTAQTTFSPWLLVIPALLLLGVLTPMMKRLGERRRTTLDLRRHLEHAATLDKPRAAAHAIEDAWRHFFHERWSLPVTLAPGEWASKLTEQGVASDTVGELAKLVDDLHYLRYAPELSAYESLRAELVERSLRLARSLS